MKLGLSALLLSLCVLGRPEAYSRMGSGVIAIMNLVGDGTTLNDADRPRRGYYEELTHGDARLAQVYGVAPDEAWAQAGRRVRRPTNDFREWELIPSLDVIAKAARFRTNRSGTRDREYEDKPRSGTCRMALLGQAPSVGGGISDEKIFEALLEDRLNRERPLPVGAYEILNFAQPAYTLLDQLVWIEKSRLFEFEPAIVLYVAPPDELDRVCGNLADAIRDQNPIPFPELREMVASANLPPGVDESGVRLRLGTRILSWAYQKIATQCRRHHVRVVWVLLPDVPLRVAGEAPNNDELISAAREAGFQVVDLSDVYQHRDRKSLRQAPWDNHANAFAHALIAERLYQELRESERTAPLGIFSSMDEEHAREGGCR